MSSLWSELRRRKVIRVTIAYAIMSWLLLQVGAILFPAFEAPAWSIKALTFALLAGLPITIILSWVFDITPQGIVVTGDEKTSSVESFTFSKLKSINVNKLRLSKTTLSSLSGRAKELNTIREIIKNTKNGHGGIVLISGESGQGKTRLGEEALAIAKDLGILPLVGHAYEEQGAPYIVATEILEEITRILPEQTLKNVLGNSAAEITRLVPDLLRIFPEIPKPIELPPGQQQRFMFNAILDLIIRLSTATPLIFLLDDLHWVDESSVQLLEHFLPHLSKHPILFIITYRDAESERSEAFNKALLKLNKLQIVTHIPLKQFDIHDVENFLKENSKQKPPSELTQLIHRETNGNVFFIQSVFKHLKDEGKLFDAQGQWLTEFDKKQIDVPDSVRLLTNQRISKLKESTQEILRTAAILGYRFRIKELEISSSKPYDIHNAIEEAEAANLIKPARVGQGLRYEFVHSLARQALLVQISAPKKQSMHLTVAQAIEKSKPRNIELRAADIAYHLVQSGDLADNMQTLNWLSRAAKHAMQAAAFDKALDFFNSALEIVSETPIQSDLLHLRAKAKLNLGNGEGYSSDMLQAFSLYKADNNAHGLATVCNELSFMMAWNNQVKEAIEFIHSGLTLVGEEVSPARCQLLSALGMAHGVSDTPLVGGPFHEDAIRMAHEIKDQSLLAHVLQNKGLMYWATFNGTQLEKTAVQGANLNKEIKHLWNQAQCLWMQEAGLTFQGRFIEADKISKILQPIAKSQENYGPLLCSELFTSIRHQAEGHLALAIKSEDLSIEYCNAAGFPWQSAMIGIRSVNKLLIGDLEGAREDINAANTQTLPSGMWAGADVCFWLAGKAFLGDDDTFSAYQSVKDKLPIVGGSRTGGQVCLTQGCIEALATIGEHSEAAKLYPVIQEVISENTAVLGFTFGLFERFAGIAAAAGQNWELAEKHFNTALKQAKTLPHRIEEPRILYWQARMLLDRDKPGDNTKAQQLLAESRNLSTALGMLGHIKLIDKLSS